MPSEIRSLFSHVIPTKVKHVHVSNISEDVWEYISNIPSTMDRESEIKENAFLADRDVYGTLSYDGVLIISPSFIGPDFLSLFKKIADRDYVFAVSPLEHSGQTSLDILNDKELFDFLTELAAGRELSISSYAASPEFFNLVRLLRANGARYVATELPGEDAFWTIDRFGSKTGLREELAGLETPICLAEGIVARDPSEACHEAMKLHAKYGGVVIKIPKGHAGAGVRILKTEFFPTEITEQERFLNTILNSDGLYGVFPLSVERRLDIDESLAGGNPSIECFIDSSGNFEYLYPCAMRVTKEGVFRGIEIGADIFSDEMNELLKKTGETLAGFFSDQGYRGFFDVDCIATRDGGLYLAECNLRRTGGTHAYTLARHLFGKDFMQLTYLLAHNLFDIPEAKVFTLNELLSTLHPILYSKDTKDGLVITSVNLLTRGQFGYVIFAPTRDAAFQVEARMEKLLCEKPNS